MTRIALLRHYPTAWNAEQRLQGRTDIALTDEARATLRTLQMPPPWNGARLISSPLRRAAETAGILSAGRPVRHDPRLVEISFGDWEGRQSKDLLAEPDSGFRPTHEWGPDYRAPGGESAHEAWRRVHPALAAIAADPQPAVVILHKALMRLILGIACESQGLREIKRGRLYPLTLNASGAPGDPGEPVRLVPR